jgi:glycosyltransferase involved in cell wall biosynthesis
MGVEKTNGDIHNDFHISKGATIVIFIGRLIREKGILQLIEAVNKIAEKHEICLLIAGDGRLYEEILQKKSECIRVLGRQSFERVIYLLSQSDMFCLPSDSEGFPTSVLEAILCRCFVITTSAGGAKEIIISSKYGSIINNNSIDTIEMAILDAMYHPDARKMAIQNAYKKFFENFTWDSVCDKLECIKWEENR